MVLRRNKVKLRKQFVIAIPIFLLVTALSLSIVLINKRSYSATIVKVETQGPNLEVASKPKTNLLQDNEIVKRYSAYMEERQKEKTIAFYADLFHLDTTKAVEIAKKLTNDFTNENFLKTNVIGNDKIINKLGSFKSFEAGAVYYARDLYRNPERYGTTSKEIIADYSIDTERNVVNKKIIVKNGLTFEQFYGKIADLFGIDKSTGLAMAYLESGRLNSKLAKNKNNIGGMRSGKGWMSFPTLEAGAIAHILTIRSISNRHGFDITDTDGIYKFSGVYVNGSTSKPSEKWTHDVLNLKAKIDKQNVFTIE